MAKEVAADTKGSGTDSLEIAQVDPNAARKSIIQRYNAEAQAERELDLEKVPGARALQAGYEQGETADTTDGDTVGEGAVQAPRAAEVAPEPVPVVDSAQPTITAPESTETVTLKVFGKEVVEPKSVVDAAGGVEARQMQLAADVRFQQAEELARKAMETGRIAADKRREYETKLSELSAGRPAAPAAEARPAATSTDSRPAAGTTAAEGEVDPFDHLVEEIYSGDPARAKKALEEVVRLRDSGQASAAIDPTQIASLVQAKVENDLAAREAFNAVEEQRRAVNDLMAGQYSNILSDPTMRADCAHLYNAAVADPRNQGRPWVVIADEVAKRVLGRAGLAETPNADVQQEVNTRTNFKRRIPQPSSATERVPAEPSEPKFPTKPSDVVNLYRHARHQPLQ